LSLRERLERMYEVFPWTEDLSTPEGKERFRRTYEGFKEVIKHPWVKELVSSKEVIEVLDVCGGTGVGGLALVKVLKELGVKTSLTVNDLRSSALEKAKVYGKELLGIEVRTLLGNALELHELGVKADIALIYGLTTPHFSPYDMVKLMASLAKVLEPNGLLMIEESDRTYTITVVMGYRSVLPEYVREGKVVLTIHSGYDVRRGMVKRIALELPSMKMAEMEAKFWDIASTAAITWVFFRDVDFISLGRPYYGILIAKEPRGLDPSNYVKYPALISER